MPLDAACPFCSVPPDRHVLGNDRAVAIRDGFPVSRGHTLIIPRRHVGSFFEVTDEERADLMELLARARQGLEQELRPAGYNIGINDGTAAGQTVPHLHIHLIPWSRYPRDLAHNLVLAHGACNSRKSDLLGGERYLERWAAFVSDHDSGLRQIGTEAGLLVDRATSVAVAEWSYGHAERVQAEVWLGGSDYGHLSAGWRRLLPRGSAR